MRTAILLMWALILAAPACAPAAAGQAPDASIPARASVAIAAAAEGELTLEIAELI